MSRLSKAMKLLNILWNQYGENSYFPVRDLEKELETNDRNIRKIVDSINSETNFNIESKPGKNGGYKLSQNTYYHFYGLTQDDILNLIDMKAVIQSNNKTDKHKPKIITLNKLVGDDALRIFKDSTERYHDTSYIHDIDYLLYLKKFKEQLLVHDLYLTEGDTPGIYVTVTYRTPTSIKKLDVLYIDTYIIGGYSYHVVYDLEKKTVDLLNENYITYTNLKEEFENPYYDSSNFHKIQTDKEVFKIAKKERDKIFKKEFVLIYLPKNNTEEIKQILLKFTPSSYEYNQEDYIPIKRTRIAELMLEHIDLFDTEIDYDDTIDDTKIISNYQKGLFVKRIIAKEDADL